MATPRAETEDHSKLRFQIELEFVQCLANPNYLNFLAQREYFKDPCFINYLKYLLYWKEPQYARFLKYPMSLYFLDLLQYPEFRKELANSKCSKFIEDQQLLHWQHYIRKRSKLISQGGSASASNRHGGSGTTGSSGAGGSGDTSNQNNTINTGGNNNGSNEGTGGNNGLNNSNGSSNNINTANSNSK